MRIEDLTRAYQTKTDEELLRLATESSQLTPEALSVLKSELASRRIDVSTRLDLRDENSPIAIQQPGTPRALAEPGGVAEFVAEVLRVYHGHFWLFVQLTLPAVVVGFIAVYMGHRQVFEIERHLPRGVGLGEHQTELFELALANFAGYLASWVAFSFSFAAISSAVFQIEEGTVRSVSDSFAGVRQRIGSVLRLSLLLFFLLIAAVAVSEILSVGMLWAAHHQHLEPNRFAVQIVLMGLLSLAPLVVSRFALAIPAAVLDSCRVGQAMFRSDELTAGRWLTLAALLVKSLAGSYVAAMLPFWIARWILSSVPLPPWFSWVLSAASIAGVTVVEPTMFIGFTLLYLRTMGLFSKPEEARA